MPPTLPLMFGCDLKFIAKLLVLAIAGLLSSCIDGHEAYWLQADGSGRAEITYQLPAAAAVAHGGEPGLRKLIGGFLKDTPEITTSTVDVTTSENRLQVSIHATFDSALAFKDLASENSVDSLPSSASHLVGDVSVKLRGRTLDFSRTIRAGYALPGSAFLPASRFDGHRMLYIMHLPSTALESNATRVENSGHTLVWDIPLAQALKEPLTTRFKMEAPIPWRLVSAIAVPILLAAGGLFLLRLRKSLSRFPDGNREHPVL